MLDAKIPTAPRDISSRAAKERIDAGYGVGPLKNAVYLAAEIKAGPTDVKHPAFTEAEENAQSQLRRLQQIKGSTPTDEFHKALGKILYDKCGLSRSGGGLKKAIAEIRSLRDYFYRDLRVLGGSDMNSELEKAGRVADYLEVGELCYDALTRKESCGAHFREEYQTPDGEAARNDKEACQVECPQEISVLHVARTNWEYNRALLS